MEAEGVRHDGGVAEEIDSRACRNCMDEADLRVGDVDAVVNAVVPAAASGHEEHGCRSEQELVDGFHGERPQQVCWI
jgi:hypothetical protein